MPTGIDSGQTSFKPRIAHVRLKCEYNDNNFYLHVLKDLPLLVETVVVVAVAKDADDCLLPPASFPRPPLPLFSSSMLEAFNSILLLLLPPLRRKQSHTNTQPTHTLALQV